MDGFSQFQARFNQTCPACEVPTKIVEAHADGDLICEDCGLVLEARTIDESTEWRTFSNSDSTGADPARVGGPNNPLLRDGGLHTVIGKGDSKDYTATALARLQDRESNPDRKLIKAFGEIAQMAERLGLVPTIKDSANELYRDVAELKSIRGRSASAVHAACLYIACCKENNGRTFKEICAGARDTNAREIGRCYKFIVKALGGKLQNEMNQNSLKSEHLVRRYCSNLCLEHDTTNAIRVCVDNFLELRESLLTSHKTQSSVTAAGIYMVTALLPDKPELKQISEVAGVAEATIKGSYEDMYPHRASLLKDLPKKFMDRLPAIWDHLLPKPKETS
ncbi:hypothetical protein CYMTET_5757 [Cymbomonas tetramitiformis]|uniref:TFIIB-type domain-containing protein n=1 Tax=Cymbomonas tetramitiformis TaxID=36881 RepID=A0AAE0LJ55_9CHLO|nr:hypothetical protein CYMTET_5757 [Cymbomonas tetramitiformis]|eukprot:gene23167-28038_t